MIEALSQAKRRCPACGSADGAESSQKNGYQILSCQKCKTIYAAQLPSASEITYDDYYDSGNLSVPDVIAGRLDEIVAGFTPYRLTNRLLDVGFGAGLVLEAAARANWMSEGVEISRTAVDHVRALGFNAFHGDLAMANYDAERFDVVVASEILEHVLQPQVLLREMRRVLRPGGLLWATTPNSRSLSYRWLGVKWSAVCPPEHLHLFSPNGIRNLFEAAGFKNTRVQTEGFNPFEIIHSFRRQKSSEATNEEPHGCERVETGYKLNEALVKSPWRRLLKESANAILRATRLGDSLKIWAER